MSIERSILLSFDVEEFDIPLEYGQHIPEEEQMRVGYEGLEETMNLLDKSGATATFFTTANFANYYPEAVRAISNHHEIASHTFYHSRFTTEDLASSKTLLEKVTGKKITGLRMPRMSSVNASDVANAGYLYDSSINPTWIPGRYNNFKMPRTIHKEGSIVRLPSSVTPFFRFPLFWLSFKNFPYAIYKNWVRQTLEKDGYVCLYFHPWEFTNLDRYKIPRYITRGGGLSLQKRLARLLNDLRCMGNLVCIDEYLTFRHGQQAL